MKITFHFHVKCKDYQRRVNTTFLKYIKKVMMRNQYSLSTSYTRGTHRIQMSKVKLFRLKAKMTVLSQRLSQAHYNEANKLSNTNREQVTTDK